MQMQYTNCFQVPFQFHSLSTEPTGLGAAPGLSLGLEWSRTLISQSEDKLSLPKWLLLRKKYLSHILFLPVSCDLMKESYYMKVIILILAGVVVE